MSQTKSDHAYDDEQLVRYLIGALDDDETERFDELSIVDDQFAERLQYVEDDLVDAYVRGELSGDTLERFRSTYLSMPARRDKVRFAQALFAHQGGAPAMRASPPSHRALVPIFAIAAAAMLVIVAGYVFIARTRSIPAEQPVASQTTRPDVTAAQPSAPADQPPARGLPPDQPPAPAPKSTAPAGVPVLAFVLMPSTRTPGALPLVTVPAGTEKVELRVVLESDDFRRYQVVLKDPDTDRTLWRSGRLAASASGNDRIVSVTLDTTSLKAQPYVLELTGFHDGGEGELVSGYPFRFVLR